MSMSSHVSLWIFYMCAQINRAHNFPRNFLSWLPLALVGWRIRCDFCRFGSTSRTSSCIGIAILSDRPNLLTYMYAPPPLPESDAGQNALHTFPPPHRILHGTHSITQVLQLHMCPNHVTMWVKQKNCF